MADNRKSISELTELPGNLSPNALLAIVQGGVTYHTDFEKLLTFIAGNMSSIALPVETWTPTILGSSADPTVTYTIQAGVHVRIGNLVFASARIAWSALTGGSGNTRISLPVAGANDDEFGQLLTSLTSGVTLPGGATAVATRPRPGGSPAADLLAMGSGLANNPAIGLTNLGSSGSIIFSGLYRI